MYLEIKNYKKVLGGKSLVGSRSLDGAKSLFGIRNHAIKNAYSEKVILFSDVNISMDKGEMITLLGQSGAGKSTFLRMLAGIENIDGGSFVLDNIQMNNIQKGKRPISLMFQEPTLFPHLNIIDNVCLPLKFKKVNKNERYTKASELLKRLELFELRKRYPFELSGGQKQRVSLARAIISSPKLLLLDEPFANLDLKLGRDVRNWMKEVIRENDMTVIFVTHNQEDALTMSPRVFLMKDAKVNEGNTYTINEFFGDGIYINNNFIPTNRLQINQDDGIPIKVVSEIMIYGEVFVVFNIYGEEKIIRRHEPLFGNRFYIKEMS